MKRFSLFNQLADFRIFTGPPVPTQPHDTEERLAEYATAHLRHAFAPVHENYRHLLYLETYLIGGVFHLNLEAISLEPDLVKLDSLKHLTAITLEAGRCIVNLETGNKPHIF